MNIHYVMILMSVLTLADATPMPIVQRRQDYAIMIVNIDILESVSTAPTSANVYCHHVKLMHIKRITMDLTLALAMKDIAVMASTAKTS
ncbi:unnamed protein product [Clavelina lepadiformis]|uniref:Secreted protein n=1 Tax=Clavelina lepadiformis TaxID=159417 RepID=A0ABP0GJ00_CLALP